MHRGSHEHMRVIVLPHELAEVIVIMLCGVRFTHYWCPVITATTKRCSEPLQDACHVSLVAGVTSRSHGHDVAWKYHVRGV